ncbi:MAG: YcaQ family DNA glycosylase [Bacteroidetes bacterium]|nr:YcaQ family DNA glycosylase [Bacteroidota bacterium]
MKTLLSQSEARHLALYHQGLFTSDVPSDKTGTLASLERLGYVQIDTISVVERAHHHILWSRQPDYQPSYLDELIADKTAFEYWSHAAAYLPMKDYRYSLLRKQLYAQNEAKHLPDKKMNQYVLDRIQAEGALKARDFEHSQKTGGWWEHKPAKRALEQLFLEGKLMIARRVNFQKVFDLTERVLPAEVETTIPSTDEFSRHLIFSAINAHGFASVEEISYLRGGNMRKAIQKLVTVLCESGELLPVSVENSKQLYYSTAKNLSTLGQSITETTHILSPFDNTVIQRKRLLQLWDFDYQIECYVPEPKRKFGYFCLPIMMGGHFIGRIDAKAERRTKQLIINSLHIEKEWTSDFHALAGAILRFAKFNGCTTISITETYPSIIKQKLEKIILFC